MAGPPVLRRPPRRLAAGLPRPQLLPLLPALTPPPQLPTSFTGHSHNLLRLRLWLAVLFSCQPIGPAIQLLLLLLLLLLERLSSTSTSTSTTTSRSRSRSTSA